MRACVFAAFASLMIFKSFAQVIGSPSIEAVVRAEENVDVPHITLRVEN